MTVGATELKVFHSLTQNCKLKMENLQQTFTENPQIDVCTYFHHLAAQHILLTTYLIHLHTELYEFAANQNLGMHNSQNKEIFFSAGITIHQLWTLL